MMSFKRFFEATEEDKNILDTISRLPRSHSALLKGFDVKFQKGNTLDGDDENVGYIDPKEKEVVVAAPWNYGREFTFLHEIGHRVWERLSEAMRHHWAQIVARTKNKQDQPPEELFCMAYANFYAKNKIVIHDHPEWHKFIRGLPQ